VATVQLPSSRLRFSWPLGTIPEIPFFLFSEVMCVESKATCDYFPLAFLRPFTPLDVPSGHRFSHPPASTSIVSPRFENTNPLHHRLLACLNSASGFPPESVFLKNARGNGDCGQSLPDLSPLTFPLFLLGDQLFPSCLSDVDVGDRYRPSLSYSRSK